MSDVTSTEVEPVEQVEPLAFTETREKILHLLEVYPYISRSMIQVGLSPSLPPSLWDPILQDLVVRKAVICEQVNTTTPKGRDLTKDVYHLPTFPYPPVTSAQTQKIAEAGVC